MNDGAIDALAIQASALRRAGRVLEAITAYEKLLALRPELAESWYNLGWLQRQARRFEAALDSYQQALDRGVSMPEEVQLNRAVILSDHLGRNDEAAAELARALVRNPDYVPALLNLGNLEEDMGERDRAKICYERALKIDPDNVLALARSAGLVSPAGPDDPLVARLRATLGRPNISAEESADLGFALGRLLDAGGDFDSAFTVYAAANRDSRKSLIETGHSVYDAGRHENFVDRLIRAFARPVEPVAANPDSVPVFICGMFRSGSSLTEQILASHSRVAAGGERDLIPSLIASHLQPYPEVCEGLGPADLDRLRRRYIDGLGASAHEDRLITDKRPDNFLHIGLIKAMFPGAKIIHTRRQPLDNILSLYFLHLNPQMSYGSDLLDAAHWYGQYRRLMSHWSALYPGDIFDLDYDVLVGDPKPAIAALLEFCGLRWEENCLAHHRAPGTVKTASVWQVREPLYRRSSGRWRNYAAHVAALRGVLEGHQQIP